MIAKALNFAALVPKHPTEALERLLTAAQSRWEASATPGAPYDPCSLSDAVQMVSRAVNVHLSEFLAEPQLSNLEEAIKANGNELGSTGPFCTTHNGDVGFARLCYCVARAIRPDTIIETGVCYGVTSSFILQALQCNAKGYLHSIDLPPLHGDADGFVGRLIPQNLRARWTLHRGTSRRLLAPLLKTIPKIDLFIHDSLHTYRNMKMEFDLAWRALAGGGVLISDDVQCNCAFQELSGSADATLSVVLREEGKSALCGLMVKAS